MQPLTETKGNVAAIMRQHNVALGYVFGSYARQENTPLSDVDIAIIFHSDVPKKNHLEQELNLARAIRHLLRVDRVDVVNLTTVSDPLLRHRATINGQPILVTDERQRRHLEVKILQEYEDTEHLRRTNAFYLKQRLASDS